MMIISASCRTDIPAFHAAWLRRRLDAGEAWVRNPYGGRPYRVDLSEAFAQAFVFWTRNPGPALPIFSHLAQNDRPFYVQMTITGYPSCVEARTPPLKQAISLARTVADRYGSRALVWRYEPILFARGLDANFHKTNFVRLAHELAGCVDEVTVAFTAFYAKTRRNLTQAIGADAFWDPEPERKYDLLAYLAQHARNCGLRLSLCTQPQLQLPGVDAAACIDAKRLTMIAKRPIRAVRRGTRPGCFCYESRDIGAYDSCNHGCAYCYAVNKHDNVRQRLIQADSRSPFLAES